MASCVFASAVKAAKRLGLLRLGWIASEGVTTVEKATVTVLVRDSCVVAVRRMQVVMDFMVRVESRVGVVSRVVWQKMQS